MPFELNLYSETDESRKRVLREAGEFEQAYLAVHQDKASDEKFKVFFSDLKSGAFWRNITFLDGTNNQLVQRKPEQPAEARAWAQASFTQQELQKIFDIIVNTALLVPHPNSWPGTYKGHSILLRDIVEKEGSVFRNAVSEDFRKTLVNGTFWEEIYDMSPGLNYGISYFIIDRILTKQYDELSIDFVRKGFNILYRNRSPFSQHFTIFRLSKEGIDKWIDFAKRIDSKREDIHVEEKDVALLMSPYVMNLLEFRTDEECDFVFRDFKERLTDPVVRRYCEHSKQLRKEITESFILSAEYGTGESIQNHLELLPVLPNSSEFMKAVFSSQKVTNEKKVRVVDICRNQRLDLKSILEESYSAAGEARRRFNEEQERIKEAEKEYRRIKRQKTA